MFINKFRVLRCPPVSYFHVSGGCFVYFNVYIWLITLRCLICYHFRWNLETSLSFRSLYFLPLKILLSWLLDDVVIFVSIITSWFVKLMKKRIVCKSAQADKTKQHRQCWHGRNLLSHCSGGWEVPDQSASLLRLRWELPSWCARRSCSLCSHLVSLVLVIRAPALSD